MSHLITQLNLQRENSGKSVQEIGEIVGIAPSNLYRMLKPGRDLRASTLEAIGSSLNAQWMLIPKHLLPEVERLLAGKSIGPDEVPSSIDRLLGESS